MHIVNKIMVLGAAVLLLPCAAFASDDDVETRGYIAALSATEVTVGSLTYALNAGTEYRDTNDAPLTLGDFNVGDLVKVKGQEISGTLTAEEMEKEDDIGGGDDDDDDDDSSGSGGDDNDDDGSQIDRIISRGPISAISPTEVTVGDLTCQFTPGTEFEQDEGGAAQLADFQVGDLAKLKCLRDLSNNLLAIELEFEDDISGSGSDDDSVSEARGAKSDDLLMLCGFPQLGAVEKGLEKSIRSSLVEAGISANVKVKGRIVEKDLRQVVSGSAAANGVSIATDTTGASNLVDLTGSIDTQPCNGTLHVLVRIKGKNTATGERVNTSFEQDLPITGVYAAKNKGKGGNS